MLTDPFGRTVDYLRISVTDRCDLRCTYCLPKGFKGFAVPKDWLTIEETARVAAAFARLGTKRFRLLLRKGLTELAAEISRQPGVEDISLTTNGTRLGQQARALRSAGVRRLNISLDSLRRDCVASITGSDCLPQVLEGITAAKEAGFERIKINMVPLKVLKEQPGYILNSMLVPFLTAAESLLALGVADFETIDKTWKLGTGSPYGPFQILDIVGLTTAYNIVILNPAAKDPNSVQGKIAGALKEKIDQGKTGISAGEGFYKYK